MTEEKIFKKDNSYYTNSVLDTYKLYLIKKRAYATNNSFARYTNSEFFGIEASKAIILRISDKIVILKNQWQDQYSNDHTTYYDESIKECLMDISIYTVIALVLMKIESEILNNPVVNCDIYLKQEIRYAYNQYIINRKKFSINGNNTENFLASRDIGISPEVGCLIRIFDKFILLKNFFSSRNLVHNETIEDTLRDIFSYSILCIHFLGHER